MNKHPENWHEFSQQCNEFLTEALPEMIQEALDGGD